MGSEFEVPVLNDKYSASNGGNNALNNSVNIVDLPIEFLLQQCSMLANSAHGGINMSNMNESLIAELSNAGRGVGAIDSNNNDVIDVNNNNNSYYHQDVRSMPNSCSQIFATAATFNISQNDTIMYARETIHLLAKFLANHSECSLFRSLYAYAPDNLAWLWAFIDWDIEVDFRRAVSTQDKYEPFKWCVPGSSGQQQFTQLSAENETILSMANKVFADAPLVQYKYRDRVMIGDLYKFIEHIHKIVDPTIAKSLFLLYFPRFSGYIDNPLKKHFNAKILSANLVHVQELDTMIVKLIRTRYNDLNEYKQRVLTKSNLPSYVESLIYDNSSDILSNPRNQNILISLINDTQFQQKLRDLSNLNLNNYKLATSTPAINSTLLNSFLVNQSASGGGGNNSFFCPSSTPSARNNINNSSFRQQNENQLNRNMSNGNSTSAYMKGLEKVRINKDLDHNDFDMNADSYADLELENQQLQQQLKTMPSIASVGVRSQFADTEDQDEEVTELNKFGVAPINHTISNCNSNSGRTSSTRDLYSPSSVKMMPSAIKSPITTFKANSRVSFPVCFSPRGSVLDERPSSSISNQTASSGASGHQKYNNFYNNSNGQVLDDICSGSNSGTNISYHSSTSMPPPPQQQQQQQQQMLSPGASMFSTAIHTPRTPSIMNTGSAKNEFSQAAEILWGHSSQQMKQQPQNLTPPPSAVSTQNKVNMFATTTQNDTSANDSQFSTRNNNANNSSVNQFDQTHYNQLARSFNQNSSDVLFGRQIAKQLNQSLATSPLPPATPASSVYYNSHRQNINISQQQYKMSDFNSAEYMPQNSNRFNFNNTNNNGRRGNEDRNAHNSNQQLTGFKSPTFANNSRSGNNNHSHFFDMHGHSSWSGRLPPKIYSTSSVYSRKVFLGGLPWDVNQSVLVHMLQAFGQVKLEIPGKDQKHPRASNKTQERNTPGYVYIIYDNESSVQRLLAQCRKEMKNGGEHFYFNISIPTFGNTSNNSNCLNGSFRHNQAGGRHNMNISGTMTGMKNKEVEVIPWNQEDTSYVPQSELASLPNKIDSKSTIFVGALHGMLNAHGLAKVMSDVFGEVIHAGLDTDKYKYPIGSGRVTFRHRASYVKAIKSKFVSIKANLDVNDPSPKFEKTIQIDPYLEDAKCCKCQLKSQLFCRNEFCLDYYCQTCWSCNHDKNRGGDHQGLSRQNKTTNHF